MVEPMRGGVVGVLGRGMRERVSARAGICGHARAGVARRFFSMRGSAVREYELP